MKKHILFSLFALLNLSAFATHNKAGDITYRWISGNDYEITVHTFTNSASPADRCDLMIYFGDGDSALAPRMNGIVNTNCLHIGVLIANNLKYNVYSVIHTYPGDGNYYITMYDPNRSSGLLNVPNSVNSPFNLHAYLKINSLFGSGNSSPVWNNYIDMDTAYVGQWHGHHWSGVDPDGDSIVYSHIPCIGGQGYVPPFNSNYFGIDPITGVVSWDTPTQLGYYAYDVLVQEYRLVGNQYYLIGNTTREIFNEVLLYNSVNDQNQMKILSTVFPNPSNSDLTIALNSTNHGSTLPTGQAGPLTMTMMDISGREIEVKYEVNDQNIVVKKQGLSPGSYLYKVFDKNGFLSTGKFEIVE